MEQLNSTVAVLSDDPALHKRVHTLLSNVEMPELHCFQHQSINLKYHAAPDLIILTLPRDQITELSTVLDALARDTTLTHLPVLVYVPEAEQAGLLEACVGGETDISSERSSRGETDRSLDDGLPGGREDL
jgi:hypothetical protein